MSEKVSPLTPAVNQCRRRDDRAADNLSQSATARRRRNCWPVRRPPNLYQSTFACFHGRWQSITPRLHFLAFARTPAFEALKGARIAKQYPELY